MDALPDNSFFALVAIHQELEELLGLHQDQLILRSNQAVALFQAYRSLLERHIAHEDHVLLPVFRRIGELKRWPAELFSGEHRKLEGFLNRIAAALAALGSIEAATPRQIVALIDLQGGLKRLMEHHDAREQECLFPILDQVTEPEERRHLLGQIESEWWHQREQLLPNIPRKVSAKD